MGVGEGDMTRVTGIGCEEAMMSCSCFQIEGCSGSYVGVPDELNVSRRCRSNGHPVPAQDDVIWDSGKLVHNAQRQGVREEECDQI